MSRLCSFSFILLYIDLWSLIPLAFLVTANLAIAGIFFVKIEPAGEEREACESVNPGLDLSNEVASPEYECDAVGWSKNIVIMSPRKESAEPITNKSEEEEGTKTPDIINEENTPIFLNAVSGIFFPICHTKACIKILDGEETFSRLFTWQKSFYRVQVVIFDIIILSVIGVIYILVTSVDTFNYNYNVLDLFWFKTAFLFLVLMGIITFLLSLDINLSQVWSQFPCIKETPFHQFPQSVDICKETYVCLLALLLISLPAIAGIVAFNISEDQTPLVIFATAGHQEGQEAVLLGAVVIQDRGDHSVNIVQGRLWSGCNSSPEKENIVVVNMTDIKCLDVLLVSQNKGNISAIIILDTSPQLSWRVTSPFHLHTKVETLLSSMSHILVVMVRTQDWASHQEYLRDGKKVILSRTRVLDWQELDMFPCSFPADTTTYLVAGTKEPRQKTSTGTAVLHKDGRITQDVNFKVSCSFYGEKCKWKLKSEEDMPVTCHNITSGHIQPYSTERNQPLLPARIQLGSNTTHSTCCKNSHTWVEIFTDYQTVAPAGIVGRECAFSDFVQEDCDRGFGQLKQVMFCSQGTFIISQHTRTLCLTGEIVFNTCDFKQYKC